MPRHPEDEISPSLDECNEFVEWLEENNEIDLNDVRIRIREVEDWTGQYIVYLEWRNRSNLNKPLPSDLIVKAGWVIEDWLWDGRAWIGCIWRSQKKER